MDFALNEDQQAFADSARALFADYCTDDALREHDAGHSPFMHSLWTQCLTSGLHSIVLSEASGGLGLGMTEFSAVLEQQGRALALVPLAEHALAAAAVARFATDGAAGPAESSQNASVQRLLDEAASGKSLLTLSFSARHNPGRPALVARRHAQGLTLEGSLPAVPLGAQAAAALVAVRLEGDGEAGWRLLLLPRETPGLLVTEGRSQHHLALAQWRCSGVQLPASHLLPAEAFGWLEARYTAALAAIQVGVSAAQLQRTVEYVSQRKQFGRAVGTFQLVAGQMADAQIALEALRSALAQLLYRLDAALGCQAQALSVKVLAAQAGHLIGHKAQHVHGGMGVDVTYPIHRYLYWSRALAAAQGGAEPALERLGQWLADNDTLGWKYDLPEDEGAAHGH